MKALTLTQPWATLVAIGAKRIETRGWSTTFRGQLAIHAAKGFPRMAKNLCTWEPSFMDKLSDAGYSGPDSLPLGSIIATVDLVDVKSTNYFRPTDPHVLLFGNYEPNRFAWFLSKPVRLAVAIPAKGALSLWEWNQEEQR